MMDKDLTFYQYKDDSNEKHLIQLDKNDNYVIRFFSERYCDTFKEVSLDKKEKF